jgi:hypothetical protein
MLGRRGVRPFGVCGLALVGAVLFIDRGVLPSVLEEEICV